MIGMGSLILGPWILSTGNVPIILFGVSVGVSSGVGISLMPALFAKLTPLQDTDFRTSTLFMISVFIRVTESPVGSAIVSRSERVFYQCCRFWWRSLQQGQNF
jgi:type III secretory pathway component EscS